MEQQQGFWVIKFCFAIVNAAFNKIESPLFYDLKGIHHQV